MSQPSKNGQAKIRAREHSAAKTRVKPAVTTITAAITNGPDRATLYKESEFCFDGTSGATFRLKFTVAKSRKIQGSIHTCVTGIDHQPDSPHEFKLSGKAHVCLEGDKDYGVYPFTAKYNTNNRSGSIQIKVPTTNLAMSK